MHTIQSKLTSVVLTVLLISSLGAQVMADDCEHTYQSTVVSPTCRIMGKTVNECTECGYTEESDFTSSVDCHFTDPKAFTPGKHVLSCEYKCGEQLVEDCTLYSWTVAGETHSVCAVCGVSDVYDDKNFDKLTYSDGDIVVYASGETYVGLKHIDGYSDTDYYFVDYIFTVTAQDDHAVSEWEGEVCVNLPFSLSHKLSWYTLLHMNDDGEWEEIEFSKNHMTTDVALADDGLYMFIRKW